MNDPHSEAGISGKFTVSSDSRDAIVYAEMIGLFDPETAVAFEERVCREGVSVRQRVQGADVGLLCDLRKSAVQSSAMLSPLAHMSETFSRTFARRAVLVSSPLFAMQIRRICGVVREVGTAGLAGRAWF